MSIDNLAGLRLNAANNQQNLYIDTGIRRLHGREQGVVQDYKRPNVSQEQADRILAGIAYGFQHDVRPTWNAWDKQIRVIGPFGFYQ